MPQLGQWATNAAYEVFDNGRLLGLVPVDQRGACGAHDSPTPNDRPWLLLGVWNVPIGDELDVALEDINYQAGDRLCAGEVMFQQIWPTVTVRADLDGTGTFGEKDDFLAACNPDWIPVEGEESRMQVQLSASIGGLYATIPGASLSQWQAQLAVAPLNEGWELWSTSTGGNALSLGQFNSSISAGNYTGTVWVSDAPNLPGDATVTLLFNNASTASEPLYAVQAQRVVIVGGKDVTQDLKTGVTRLQMVFSSLSSAQKKEIFQALAGSPTATSTSNSVSALRQSIAWDILTLKSGEPEVRNICRLGCGGISPPGVKPHYTATVNGEVYGTDAINYILYGAIMRLCYDWYWRVYPVPLRGDPLQSQFSLAATVWTVRTYRSGTNLLDGSGVETAAAFAEVGWTGDWSYIKGLGIPGAIPNKTKYMAGLEWRVAPSLLALTGLITGQRRGGYPGVIDFDQGPTLGDYIDHPEGR